MSSTSSGARAAAELWEELWESAPQGYDAPVCDRGDVDRAGGEGASAYGELPAEPAARLFRWLRLSAEDVFVDLGSGTGKLVAQAVCTTPVGGAVGVELSTFRHQVAETTWARLRAQVAPEEGRRLDARVRWLQEDLRVSDLSQATVVYAGATCFPTPLLSSLAARAYEAPRLRAQVMSMVLVFQP